MHVVCGKMTGVVEHSCFNKPIKFVGNPGNYFKQHQTNCRQRWPPALSVVEV